MGWIKNFGIGLVIFSMIFIAFFSLFQTMDSGYDYSSGFNYTDNTTHYLNSTVHSELQTSYSSSDTQKSGFQNGTSLTSGSAYDNLISAGYSVLTSVWNYPIQVYSLTTNALGQVLGIDSVTYGWLYAGIYTIIVLLILFAIINIIFRSDV